VRVKHKVDILIEFFVTCLAQFLKIDSAVLWTLPASNGKSRGGLPPSATAGASNNTYSITTYVVTLYVTMHISNNTASGITVVYRYLRYSTDRANN
jgi:hypothetical protein